MKKRTLTGCLLAAALLFNVNIAGAKEKPVMERGWIGGTYKCARSRPSASEALFGRSPAIYSFPAALAKSQRAAVLLTSLATNTPAYLAGLREGDLVLTLNSQPVTDLPEFWPLVNNSRPGASLAVHLWREGKTLDFQVIVGREKYQQLSSFTVALPGFFKGLHLVPTREVPRFSLVALGYESTPESRSEFASVKEHYQHECDPKSKQTGYDTDWRLWLAIIEVKSGKTIVAQEVVPAAH